MSFISFCYDFYSLIVFACLDDTAAMFDEMVRQKIYGNPDIVSK
jgi:hypothetical protein